jgi:hypothetical protein
LVKISGKKRVFKELGKSKGKKAKPKKGGQRGKGKKGDSDDDVYEESEDGSESDYSLSSVLDESSSELDLSDDDLVD